MLVSLFSLAIIKLDELFAQMQFTLDEQIHMLKLLEYATMIELEVEDELPVVILKNFKEMSHGTARFIVNTRNGKPFSDMSLAQERQVYKLMRKIISLK